MAHAAEAEGEGSHRLTVVERELAEVREAAEVQQSHTPPGLPTRIPNVHRFLSYPPPQLDGNGFLAFWGCKMGQNVSKMGKNGS